jgi:hypothetical protein
MRSEEIAGNGVARTMRTVGLLATALFLAACSNGGGQQSSPKTTVSYRPPLTTVPCARSPRGSCLVPGIPVSTWTNADTRAFMVNWDDNVAKGTLLATALGAVDELRHEARRCGRLAEHTRTDCWNDYHEPGAEG